MADAIKTAEKQQVGVPFTKDDPRINRDGRPPGSGISITTEIKKKLEEVPDGQKATYLELLINRIFKQAIQDGDQQMIKNIWNYIDGMPKQSTDITSGGKPIPILGGVANVHTDSGTPETTETQE
jgi:hypothetical protein